MSKKNTETRSIILDILMEMEKENQKANVLLRNVINKYNYLDLRDKAFIRRIAEGCIKEQLKLDYIISKYAVTKNGKMKPVIRNILRMGIYQILEMDSVPDSAACNEAVNLAISKGLGGLKGFVNGVLRSVAREKEHLPWPDKSDLVYYFSIIYSMPEWIVRMWLSAYGVEKCEKMLQALQEPSKLTIHIREDLSVEQKNNLLDEIREAGYEINQHSYLTYAYVLGKNEGVERIPGFLEGLVTIQDVSSMLAVECAEIKGSEFRIVDVCAAPGGKSIHAAIKVGNKGEVISRDLTKDKTCFIEENASRMQLENIVVEVHDALVKDESLIEKADIVIADLPCSGMGIMGRKGDIRYHISEKQIDELQKLQREILQVVASYVKPGGKLLFSTCTVNQKENYDNYKWIGDNLGFVPLSFYDCLADSLKEADESVISAKDGYLQLLPGIYECDGFFISLFRKDKNNY